MIFEPELGVHVETYTWPSETKTLAFTDTVLYVQEVVTHICSNLLYEMGHYFLGRLISIGCWLYTDGQDFYGIQ